MRAVVRWLLRHLLPARRPPAVPPPPPVVGKAKAPDNWYQRPERGPVPDTHPITWRPDWPPQDKHRNDGRWEDQP